MKKKLIVPILAVGFVVFLISASPPPPPPPPFTITEQHAPILKNFWVQKLETPLEDGSNMLIKIEYEEGNILPTSIDIYTGDATPIITVYDDGTGADDIADDGIYAGYIEEDISAFIVNVEDMVNELVADGGYLKFTGHTGQEITTITSFDVAGFNAGSVIKLDPDWLNVIKCLDALKKENSLFVTDLDVVEDPARTYNYVTATGNQTGIWTFGNMIKNIVNSTNPNASRDFLRDWVKHWMTTQTVNGQSIAPRETQQVIDLFIGPWLTNCGYPGATVSNWESKWNQAAESNILEYAPFKLTAIVNRIDLRGSAGYTPGMGNGGETRFIFSLVSNQGNPPKHPDQDFNITKVATEGSLLDWEGMNIILEYGNVQNDICDVKSFAQQWLDLSQLTLGSQAYNEALEDITETVINANAAPSKTNGSALSRLRTNERIFAGARPTWDNDFWELRQFELDPQTGKLVQTPVTNTPIDGSNYPWNINGYNFNSVYTTMRNLLNWSFDYVIPIRLQHGAHNIPLEYPNPGDYLLAGSALVSSNYTNYWDYKWDEITSNFDYHNLDPNNNPAEVKMRQQLSLNTCQGCHTGETKTMFTHILPLGYGQTAEYWNTTPDNVYRTIDTRFFENLGVTGSSPNYPEPIGQQYHVKVSAFLTGRNYTGTSGNGTFEDDEPADPADNSMNGLFYVNDPSNNGSNTLVPPEKKWGYNDLERRKNDMCRLMKLHCSDVVAGTRVINVMGAVAFNPFPVASH